MRNELLVVVICPTLNANDKWKTWISSLKNQSTDLFSVLIIDSGSSDSTVELAKNEKFEVIEIDSKDFNHGGTRNLAVNHICSRNTPDILIFLTQDAVLAEVESIQKIIEAFNNPFIGAVFGRQKPNLDADPVAQHSRLFNYGLESNYRDRSRIVDIGLKAAFMSNSFAAYRYLTYKECGGFPEDLIFGEDMYLAAKMILQGYKTYYCAEATVYHSHNYTLIEEFKRYFDIGVFHSSQPFLLENFGKPSGEGFKFAHSELKYTLRNGGVFWALNSLTRTFLKFIGYQLGKKYNHIPRKLCRELSMSTNYWNKQ